MTPKKKRPLIVTVMRVKNEEKYIAQAIESVLPLGGPIVFLNDNSSDSTANIARSYEAVQYHGQGDVAMDEGRDRTFLYREAMELKPDWIFTLDGDEVLATETPEIMLRAAELAPRKVNVFEMCIAVMATTPEARRKKWFGTSSMERMFRAADAVPGYEFTGKGKGNLHCGCVPAMRDRKKEKLNAWIEYYGYESPEAVARKKAFYDKHDPHKMNTNVFEMIKASRGYWPNDPDAREWGIVGTVRY